MNKILRKVLSSLLLAGFTMLQTMQQEITKTIDDEEIVVVEWPSTGAQHQIIQGNVFLVKNSPAYVGYGIWDPLNIIDESGNPLQLQTQDVLFEVVAADKDSEGWGQLYWSHRGHQELGAKFPSFLPLSLLDGKKEGDIVSFFFKNKKQEIAQIQLTCCQRQYHFNNTEDFQTILQSLKDDFARKPHFALGEDTDKLLSEKIIEIYTTASGRRAYRHGPAGFKGKYLQETESEQTEKNKQNDNSCY